MVEEDREICTYEFKHTERKDSAKGVEVKFSKSKRTKNVDVCHKVKYSAIIEVIFYELSATPVFLRFPFVVMAM